jgi:hypothetical protein
VLEGRVEERRQKRNGKKRAAKTAFSEQLDVQPASKADPLTTGQLPNTVSELEALLPRLEGSTLLLAVHKLQRLLQEQNRQDGLVDGSETGPEADQAADAYAAELQEELDQLRMLEEVEEEGENMLPNEAVNGSWQKQALSERTARLPQLDFQPVRVRMEGKFGRSATKFLTIEQHDNQLVLIYDPEENIFVPSVNGEPFNISFNNKTLQVQNVGIEFDLDFLQVGVLVLVILGS